MAWTADTSTAAQGLASAVDAASAATIEVTHHASSEKYTRYAVVSSWSL